jgi:hypothetical protein
MKEFVQLTYEDCKYLLELIQDMDSETKYTEKQRYETIPKLQRIQQNPRSARIAFQDVEYLLDLIEDDDLLEAEAEREHARATLLEIQELQNKHLEYLRDIENQRESRRLKRLDKR